MLRLPRRSWLALSVAFVCAACGAIDSRSLATRAIPPNEPYVVVLGSAQDAGVPQIAGRSPYDEAARRDPRLRRLAASLLIVDPRSGTRFLIDATPDLREQVELADRHLVPRAAGSGARPPLFDAIFLTHAHLGHVAGLLQLGREAYAADGQRVVGSESMVAFLGTNAPWELLSRLGHVRLETFAADASIELGPELSITPVAVPHRAETSDTHGFVIRGPHRALLYVPDIDKWERWDRRIEDLLAEVDVACLDGTFFADGEIPGRSMAEIPHPFVVETIARLAPLPEAERRKVVFTHLNHTNALLDPEGEARRTVRDAGMRVAEDGDVIPL